MPRIVAVTDAFPEHEITQQGAKGLMSQVFGDKIVDNENLLEIFDNSRIETRRLLMPPGWYLKPHTPAENNQIFLDRGFALLREAADECLSVGDIPPQEVDHVICVNSTGHATPTLDARLINDLALLPDTSRLPIWGLGCAAGAVGLSRAFDYCQAHPKALVLLGALEGCSLTFMSSDLSKKNLIGTSLFADGAATVLVAGDETDHTGPEIVATRSHLYPDTYRIMGWDFVNNGMELVLSPRLPALIEKELPNLIDSFLSDHHLNRKAIKHYVTHPGGAKVIDAFRDALDLDEKALSLSEQVLREHGNVSSVSVLSVLKIWLDSEQSNLPGNGLISAFGPGFSAELLLIKV